jgi:hypothetical protein
MASSRAAGVAVVALLAVAACTSHDPAKELEVFDIQTYWIVDSPRGSENYIAPAVRFHLRNVGSSPLGSIDARARFPGTDPQEPWGSIQVQVTSWRKPLEPGEDTVVTVRSVGRYHAAADPQDMLRSPGFKDPRAEIFVRIGNSNWAELGEAVVERRIGAPGVEKLLNP